MRSTTSLNRQLKEKIISFKGTMSYREMSKLLNCSKSTVNYHLTEGAAEKIKSREGSREWRKVCRYCYEKGQPKKFMLKSLVSLEKLEELFYMDHQDQMKGKTEWD
jgi:hypothetical protein